MNRPGWGRAAGAVAAVLVVIVVGLLAFGVAQSRPLVVLAGDSITERGAGTLGGAIDGTFGVGGHDVAVVARSGATAGEMEAEVSALAADSPQQVVINLGTNDAVRTGTVADGIGAIERIAGAFPAATCIHLVTLSESVVTFEDPVGPGQRAAELNRGLVDLANRNGYGLIRWDQIVAEGVARGAPLTLDSIHPDGAGEAELAEGYRAAIDSC